MKQLLTYLTIALSLMVWLGTNAQAEPSSNQLTVSMSGDGYDIRDEDPFGFRMPAAPITCTIDFTALSIISNRISSVLSYELWDDTREEILASYSNDYDMVVYMSTLTGCYQLRLVTEECTYIGYINL